MTDHIHIQELILAEFDGETTEQEKGLIEKHLKECPSCQEYSSQIHKLSATLKEWTNEDLSPDLDHKIQQGLKEAIMSRGKITAMQHPLFKVGVGGGGVLVAILVLVLSMQVYNRGSFQGRIQPVRDNWGTPYSSVDAQFAGRPIENEFSENNKPFESSAIVSAKYVAETKDNARRRLSVPSNQVAYQDMKEKSGFQESSYDLEKRALPDTGVKKNELAYNVPMAASGVSGGVAVGEVSQSRARTLDGSSSEARKAGNRGLGQGSYDLSLPSSTSALQISRADRLAQVNRNDNDSFYAGKSQRMPSDAYDESYEGAEYFGGEELTYEHDRAYFPYQRQSNTEEYALIYENSYQETRYNPLSTFSVDVDTTSYSNIRRFLNQGQLPPADAVRIEEMVNYFQYDYPQPGWNKPFSITTEASYCPWNSQHYLVQIGIKGKMMDAQKLPPSNLVFLIDVSGSMNQPNKLPLLKNAFNMFVDQLSANERVAIVVYADSAGVVLDSTPGSEKWLIRQAIDNLNADGSTAGGAGLQLAYDIAQKNFFQNGNNRVILATDGDFNVGVSSDSELVRLIEDKKQSGVFLTILGFGSGNYKDAKMEQIADKGNGNYFYIDNLSEGRKVLVNELGSTLFTIAKDVKLQIEFNPAQVQSYRLVGYENRAMASQDFKNDAKDAGELGAGHTVTAFYEVIPTTPMIYSGSGDDPLKYQNRQNGFFINNELMTVKLRYKNPNESVSKMIKQAIHKGDLSQNPSSNFQFASAVAEFGLLLRDSQYKAHASYDNVLIRARQFREDDPYGHKTEFLNLVEKAKNLDHRPAYYSPLDYPHYEPSGPAINFKGQ